MAYPVKFFNSEMGGAPQLTNSIGALTALLDACLVNGFNALVPTSLTFAAGVVTVTFGAAHGYVQEQIITVSGCVETAYNGDQKVSSVPNPTTLTYAISGSPSTPATTATAFGTIATPLGFTIGFTGTNKRAYRSANSSSNKPYLRVDDGLDPLYNATYAKKGKVLMCQDMYDINTPKGAYAPYAVSGTPPLGGTITTGSGQGVIDGWYRWYYAKDDYSSTFYDYQTPATGIRRWFLIGDDRGFFLSNETTPAGLGIGSGSYGKGLVCFTDFFSYKTADAYNTLLTATDYYQAASNNWGSSDASMFTNPLTSNDGTGKILMRDHHQQGYNVSVGYVPLNTGNATSYSGYSGNGIPYPNGPDYGLVLHPVYLRQTANAVMRGKMPGMYWVHNDLCTVNDQTIFDTVTNYAGRKFIVISVAHQTYSNNTLNMGGAQRVAFDITGPWW